MSFAYRQKKKNIPLVKNVILTHFYFIFPYLLIMGLCVLCVVRQEYSN